MPLPRGVAVGADLQHADLLRDHRHREHGLGGGRSVAGFPPAGDIWFAPERSAEVLQIIMRVTLEGR